MLEEMWKCKECEEEAKVILAEDCLEWEDGLKEENLSIFDLDVVALFPSLKSMNSLMRLMHMVIKSDMEIKGFKWKKGAWYVGT